jgi:hypothetical protein
VCRDSLEAFFGKGAVDWRLILCLEARHNAQAKAELDSKLSHAASAFDYPELERFASAMKCIASRNGGNGFAAPDKARAILFVVARALKGHPVESGNEIEQFLESCDPGGFTGKRHNLSRILKGPVLGRFKGNKAGRPPAPK